MNQRSRFKPIDGCSDVLVFARIQTANKTIIAKQMTSSTEEQTSIKSQNEPSDSTETFTTPTSSEIALDPRVAERVARLKLLTKLQEYERRCHGSAEEKCQLIENGLLSFIASTVFIEELAIQSMRTLLVLLEDEEDDNDYYQNYIEPYVNILLPVLLRLIFTSRNQEVLKMTLCALCSMTSEECRYTATIAHALERRPFLVQLTYFCQGRPRRRISVAVSEQATILVDNILRHTCNCSASDLLTEVVNLASVEENQVNEPGHLRASSRVPGQWRHRRAARKSSSSTSTSCFPCCCPAICLISAILLLILCGALVGSL